VISSAVRRLRGCDGQQPGDDAGRLRVLDDPLFGQLLDDADAPGAQGIPEDPENLPAAGRHAFGAAHATLFHAHAGEAPERLFV